MSIYDIDVTTINGRVQSMAEYRGKTLLIVNVASRCGFTPQYAGLEALYREYKDRDFVVLGFPCNQFLSQEPGNEAEIQQFCSLTYNVTFPIFGKVKVNGWHTHPLFAYLKKQKRGWLGLGTIKWNFTKFLVDNTGRVVKRYSTKTTPEQIRPDIESTCASAYR